MTKAVRELRIVMYIFQKPGILKAGELFALSAEENLMFLTQGKRKNTYYEVLFTVIVVL